MGVAVSQMVKSGNVSNGCIRPEMAADTKSEFFDSGRNANGSG